MGNKGKQPVRKSGNNFWLIAGGAVIMICIVWFTLRATHSGIDGKTAANSAPVTLVATLSPEKFMGKARAAYQVAMEIPEILAQLPCFCGCMESLGHKSNLDCFADEHGGDCDLCQSIALDAKEMHAKGISVSQIRDNIRTTYSHIQ